MKFILKKPGRVALHELRGWRCRDGIIYLSALISRSNLMHVLHHLLTWQSPIDHSTEKTPLDGHSPSHGRHSILAGSHPEHREAGKQSPWICSPFMCNTQLGLLFITTLIIGYEITSHSLSFRTWTLQLPNSFTYRLLVGHKVFTETERKIAKQEIIYTANKGNQLIQWDRRW